MNIAVQLLSSFEGAVIYPKEESKEEIFTEATDNNNSLLIPDGTYTFKRRKKSDGKLVKATVVISGGRWKLLKGSSLGISEGPGVSTKAKGVRIRLPLDNNGILLDDFDLGECSPSHAGVVVMNQSINGWASWKNTEGQPVDIYRQRKEGD